MRPNGYGTDDIDSYFNRLDEANRIRNLYSCMYDINEYKTNKRLYPSIMWPYTYTYHTEREDDIVFYNRDDGIFSDGSDRNPGYFGIYMDGVSGSIYSVDLKSAFSSGIQNCLRSYFKNTVWLTGCTDYLDVFYEDEECVEGKSHKIEPPVFSVYPKKDMHIPCLYRRDDPDICSYNQRVLITGPYLSPLNCNIAKYIMKSTICVLNTNKKYSISSVVSEEELKEIYEKTIKLDQE